MKDSIELLTELIACRPVSADIVAVNCVTAKLHDYLAEHGLHCREETFDGRKVLFAATEETTRPAVLMNTHVDVVPAEDEQFTARVQDGWLHGRGSTDCLGNTVVAVQTLICAQGKASVGAFFSADEEIGGMTTAAMVQKGYGAETLILVLDGSHDAIAIAQKGILSLTLSADGSAAHASTPWLGDNAIDRLIDGYLKIRDMFPAVRAGDEWHNTLVASVMNAGTVSNRIPDKARMTLNIRFTEPAEQDAIPQRIAELSGLEVSAGMACAPVVFDEETPAFADLRACMNRTLGRDIRMVRMNGATDARHFVNLDVPIAIIGVPGRDVHGQAEAVHIGGLREYEEMLGEFLTS